MNTRIKPIFFILVSLMLIGGLVAPQPVVLANNTAANLSASTFQESSETENEMLIVLPVEPISLEAFSGQMTYSEAKDFAYQKTFSQAAALIIDLERLIEEGQLSRFEVRPDLHGIVLYGLDAEHVSKLSFLPGVASFLPLEEEASECGLASAKAIIDQAQSLSKIASLRQSNALMMGSEVQATNPSIEIYASEGDGNVFGMTNADTTVNLRIIRGGNVVATESTTSDSEGYYYFYPHWQSCPTSAPNWSLRPGDVVEVSAAGKTYSTEVVDLTAWMDPVTNQVSGVTAPGRTVKIDVYQPNSANFCSNGLEQTMTTISSSNGSFNADFSSLVNYDRSASAKVSLLDANGNGMVQYPQAFYISVGLFYGDIYGTIKPTASYTINHRRGGSIIYSISGTSSATGSYYAYFMDSLQADDIIEVSSGGMTMQYTIAPLNNIAINPNTDQISGITTAGRRVRTDFRKSGYYSSIPTSCSYGRSCGFQVAGGGGNFTITATNMDLVRGDTISLLIYDNEGNYQRQNLRVPAISVDVNTQRVSGVWSTPQVPALTITHRNSGGTIKNTYSDIWPSYYDNNFYQSLLNTIEPGDRFEVSDGTTTETMTVPATFPTARLNITSGHLTGSAPSGSSYLIAFLNDYRQTEQSYYDFCEERTISGGAFDISFSGAHVSSSDWAYIYIRGSDGHYMQLNRTTFNVYTWLDYSDVRGYTETPNTNLTIRLRRGGSIIDTIDMTSTYTGSWNTFFNPTVQVGDRIEVSTADGNSVNLDIPQLTLNMDVAANRIHGKSPANQPIFVQLNRHYKNGSSGIRQETTADAGNNYSVSFNDKYITNWSQGVCAAASVGHRCAGGSLYYYTTAGHGVYVWGGWPSPAAADSFENDNSIAEATPYTIPQTHTFHTEDDEDWVSFTVPAGDVGTHFYMFRTYNQGWFTDTNLRLYRANGELIAEIPMWSSSSTPFYWLPDAAGTYYVRVTPFYFSSSAHCDAFYDLMILPVRAQVSLPLVKR